MTCLRSFIPSKQNQAKHLNCILNQYILFKDSYVRLTKKNLLEDVWFTFSRVNLIHVSTVYRVTQYGKR